MSSISDSTGHAGERTRQSAPGLMAVRIWLFAVAGLIFAMVLVGGATRLTNSGLSITEWKPLLGAIPPLSEADWQDAFAKYKQIPEYQLINKGMSLAAFKAIYWWEWTHRLLGRLIGVAFFVPFLVFWLRGAIPQPLFPKLAVIFVLGGAQGALGWYMVQSGLAERTDVSQYRLAAHLGLAVLIYGAILWVAFGLGRADARRGQAPAALKAMAGVFAVLVFLQIILGAFVAGTDAGLSHNTWPLMDGALIPDGLGAMQPWYLNLFENVLTVQFDHRMARLCDRTVRRGAGAGEPGARGAGTGRRADRRFAAVLAQIALGIFALLSHLQIGLALAHQAGAMLLFALALYQLHRLTGSDTSTKALKPALAPLEAFQVLEAAPLAAAAAEIELLHILVARKFGGGAVEHDLALLHDIAVARHLQRGAGVLLDQQDGDAEVAVDAGDDAEHLLHQQRRQAHGRLVHQDQLRPRHQRPPDRQHLLLAAGEIAGKPGALLEAREIAQHHVQIARRFRDPCG